MDDTPLKGNLNEVRPEIGPHQINVKSKNLSLIEIFINLAKQEIKF